MNRLFPLMLVLIGCSKMAIDGEVVDATGQPIEGANVTAIGTTCTTKSGADGSFVLECLPGQYQISVAQEGYIAVELDFDAGERKRYDAGKQVLVQIPDSEGLFLFADNVYHPMKEGRLIRQLDNKDGKKYRAFCLDRSASEPNKMVKGVWPFFDHEHMGWRPFRLDAEGCAYRDVKNEKHQWSVEYREKPPYETHQLELGKTIARMELAPGEYFIADWKGFFVTAEGEKHTYSGHWLSVQ